MAKFDDQPIAPPPDAFTGRFDSFEADVWADAADLARDVAGLDTDSLHQIFTRAVSFGDLKRIALAGPALIRQNRLTRGDLFMLGRALVAQGRLEEAAEIFDHPWISGHASARYAVARARTLAALGRLAPARAALDGAPPSPIIEDLRETISSVMELTDRELQGWSEIAKLATGYLALGLTGPAAALLAPALAEADAGELAPAERLDLAALALQAGLADQVAAYLRAIPRAKGLGRPRRTLTAAASAMAADQVREAPPAAPAETPGKALGFWRALENEAHNDLEGAIAQLSALADDFKLDLEIRAALARCVGKSVLAETRPSFQPGRTGRIINVMPFFNEVALLRLHLEEMAPWVDRFVIVEAVQSFTGMDKPLHFEANRGLFEDFADKIVHVPIRSFPAHLTSPWARDFFQRDMAITGASGLCGEEDYILETDVDEVIDGRTLEGFEADFAALELKLSRFFLNYRPTAGNPQRARPKASIFKAKRRTRHGISYGRFFQSVRYPEAHLVRDAGWHFTSMFDAEGLSLKVRSYAHQEHNKDHFRAASHFQPVLDRLRAGRLDPGWERAELDDSFPASLLRRRDDFGDMIL